jgi:hypothetical protein
MVPGQNRKVTMMNGKQRKPSRRVLRALAGQARIVSSVIERCLDEGRPLSMTEARVVMLKLEVMARTGLDFWPEEWSLRWPRHANS